MNWDEAKTPGQGNKVSWTEPNLANLIEAHLRVVLPEATGVDGIWVTGSNVWRFVYGDMPEPGSDIDVIAELQTWTSPRQELKDRLKIVSSAPTAPSTVSRPDLNGAKHLLEDGRTIDIWENNTGVTGIAGVVLMLREYPEHSHAHCRAAYNPSSGMLLVLPNTKAQ